VAQSDFCNRCHQAHDCKRIYEQLGKAEEPSVTRKVLIAFLLPITVFVVALALFGRLLGDFLAPRCVTLIACVLASAVTVAVMWAVSLILTRFSRSQ
jgi:protein-S-isoprenylcysteine O-methyltransferase Ste14